MRRGAWILGLGAVVLLHARAYAQAALPLELEWQAPPECAQAADVHAELARVARVRPGFELTRLRVRGKVTRGAAGYAALLYTERDGSAGERRLNAADCTTLVRSVTLVLALAFGEGVEMLEAAPAQAGSGTDAAAASQTRPAEEARGESEQPARDVPPGAPAPGVDAPPQSAPDVTVVVLLGGGAQLGLLPAPALSLLVGAGLGYGALSVDLRAAALAPVETDVRQEVQARFDGLVGTLQGCGNLPGGAFVLALCGGARAGALRGRSSGVSSDGSATAPWFALATATSLSWPRTQRVRGRLEGALVLTPGRPRFAIENVAEVHRVPLLAFELTLLLVLGP